jgi:hypothetical protein
MRRLLILIVVAVGALATAGSVVSERVATGSRSPATISDCPHKVCGLNHNEVLLG